MSAGQPQSLAKLLAKQSQGEKISCLTAYDAGFARLAVQAGVDMLLVGDSLGMVVQGMSSTIGVSLDEMVYHTQMVRRGAPQAWVIADMPFMSDTSIETGLQSAKRLLQQGQAQMVKLEGGQELVPLVQALTQHGVPVCGHLGLLPQQVLLYGYRYAGKTEADVQRLLDDALALQAAGVNVLVLECVVPEVAKRISQALTIPTIGIGSGADTDGQVLVLHDVLGISEQAPSFAPSFMVEGRNILQALTAYVQAVKQQTFPSS